MLEDLIEKAKSIDFKKLEREIEEEGNRIAKKCSEETNQNL